MSDQPQHLYKKNKIKRISNSQFFFGGGGLLLLVLLLNIYSLHQLSVSYFFFQFYEKIKTVYLKWLLSNNNVNLSEMSDDQKIKVTAPCPLFSALNVIISMGYFIHVERKYVHERALRLETSCSVLSIIIITCRILS